MTLLSFPCFAPLQSKEREQRKSQTSTSRIKVAETLVNFMLAVLGAHLRPECTISTPKRGETPVNCLLAVLGAHLQPECTISTPKNRETPVIFVLAVLGAHSRFGAGLRRRPQIDRKRLRPNLGQPPITVTLETFDESAAQNVRDAEVPRIQSPRGYPNPQNNRFPILKKWRAKPLTLSRGFRGSRGPLGSPGVLSLE